MAEQVAVTVPRRWTNEAAARSPRGLLPARLRVTLLLATLCAICGGVAAGFWTWWEPLARPQVIILATQSPGAWRPERAVAARCDAAALARRLQLADYAGDAMTRRDVQHYLTLLRLAKPRDHVVLYVCAAAGVNSSGEVVLFTDDVGPESAEEAFSLRELLTATDECRARGALLLLDLTPAAGVALDHVPPADLAERIDRCIAAHAFTDTCVLTACSPGERSLLMPGRNRSLFGWVVDHGLSGAADGAAEVLADGRVTTDELLAYLQAEMPPLAQRVTGETQQPRAFGEITPFELTVAQPAFVDEFPPASEYPKWLMAAWQGSPRENVRERWFDVLRRAELATLGGAPPEMVKALRAEAEVLGKDVSTRSGNEPDPDTVAKLEVYRHKTWDVLLPLTTADRPAAARKAAGEFIAANAKLPAAAVNEAAIKVARQSDHIVAWQCLAEVLKAWPKRPENEHVDLFLLLVELRLADPDSESLRSVAYDAFRTALELDRLADEALAWQRLRPMLDAALDDQVHAEVLLLAREHVRLDAAVAAQDVAFAHTFALVDAAERLEQLEAFVAYKRQFLLAHAELAASEPALTIAWVDTAAALAELAKQLDPTLPPPATFAELRQRTAIAGEAWNRVTSSSIPLSERVGPLAIAAAIAACRQNDADAHDVRAARRLFASPELRFDDRSKLWQACEPLALRLEQSTPTTALARGELLHGARGEIAARQERMADAWAKLPALASPAASLPANEHELWRREWRRFRAAELARVTSPGTSGVWSLEALDVLGPWSCADLSPERPEATFEFDWRTRLEKSPVEVSAIAPGDALAVEVSPRSADSESARMTLRLRGSPLGGPTSSAGFMAVLATAGKRYHAPIALPSAGGAPGVKILLSSDPQRLVPLDELALVGERSNVFVWLENNSPAPVQAQLGGAGLPTLAPVPLAPFAAARVPLPPPAAPVTTDRLTLVVLDASTHRQLAQRDMPFISPAATDLVRVESARVSNDPAQGLTLSVNVAPLPSAPPGVNVSLRAWRTTSGGREPLAIRGGRTQAMLTPAAPVELNATLAGVRASDVIHCELMAAGVPSPLTLMGTTPTFGSAAPLRLVTDPGISLDGIRVSAPSDEYVLSTVASNTPAKSKLNITLRTDDARGQTVLSRQCQANAPARATLGASSPAGGLGIEPLTSPPGEVFNTSGLVGRFVWQAELMADDGRPLASGTLPVVFDDSPPTACRLVEAPAVAAKGLPLALTVTGWDDLSGVDRVELFIGAPVESKLPPAAKLFPATHDEEDASLYRASPVMPGELGPCQVTASITNGAGLTTFVTTTIDVAEKGPAGVAEIRGVVLEGSRPQAGLEVALEKSPGAAVNKTKTDERGAFVFHGVAPGSYTVKSAKPASQRSGQAPVVAEAGKTANATIKLGL